MSLRSALSRFAQATGVFLIASRLSGRAVRVLCYHGFSLDDEHLFRPRLFITAETFERRLQWLVNRNFEPVSLQTAIARLKRNTVRGRELVVTIDDGFASVKAVGWPLLQRYGIPATLYVTTYYTVYGNPIFRLALQYMVWRTSVGVLDVRDLALPLPVEDRIIRLKPVLSKEKLWALINVAESEMSEEERVDVGTRLGLKMGVDYQELRSSRRLSLLNGSEIVELHRSGMDVQLHTHRHRLPLTAAAIRREIQDNRGVLEPLLGSRLTHFCYPSGVWDVSHWPTLEAEGVESAATCNPGFNNATTPLLALRRFLDSEALSMVDLDAELSGFKSAVRYALGRRAGDASGTY